MVSRMASPTSDEMCTHCFPELTPSHLFGSGYMQTSVLVMYCFYPTAGGTMLTPNRIVL